MSVEVRFTNDAAPATPPTGKTSLYVDESDKHIKTKDDAGTIEDLTGGGAAVTVKAKQTTTADALGTGYSAITGCSVALPSAGTYCITYHGRGEVDAPGKFVVYRLFDVTGAAAIADTEGLAGFDNAGTFTNSQNMASNGTFLTVSGATTVRLEAKGSTATGCRSLSDGTVGRTVLLAHKV